MQKRAILIGHTAEKPGAVRTRDGKTERQILESFREYLNFQIKPSGNTVIIDKPHGQGTDISGIFARIAEAKRQNVEFAIELHINNVPPGKTDNYSLLLYSESATPIAEALKEHFAAFIRDAGVERWVMTKIPDPNWPNFAAITQAPYPAIIFEPFFINNPKHTVAERALFEFCPLLVKFMETYKNH